MTTFIILFAIVSSIISLGKFAGILGNEELAQETRASVKTALMTVSLVWIGTVSLAFYNKYLWDNVLYHSAEFVVMVGTGVFVLLIVGWVLTSKIRRKYAPTKEEIALAQRRDDMQDFLNSYVMDKEFQFKDNCVFIDNTKKEIIVIHLHRCNILQHSVLVSS